MARPTVVTVELDDLEALEGIDAHLPLGVRGRTLDLRRLKKPIVRKTIDYSSSIIRYIQNRPYERDFRDQMALQPTADYAIHVRLCALSSLLHILCFDCGGSGTFCPLLFLCADGADVSVR